MNFNFKNFGLLDVALTKSAVFFATLFLVSAWGAFASFVASVHWAWFLAIALALAAKPMIKSLKK
jgi:hypothetical protein